MSERWHMNRIGFVNFWLYDDEVFSFADVVFVFSAFAAEEA